MGTAPTGVRMGSTSPPSRNGRERVARSQWNYAIPLRQVDVLLHWRQILSPAQALGNSWRQTKQRRVLASLDGAASFVRSSDTSSASFVVQGSRMSHLLHKLTQPGRFQRRLSGSR